MDLTESIIPRSDQINADDLIAGPVTVTIENVTAGAAEQPFDFHLVEYPGRAYRPSKSMRRVIVTAWGADTTPFAGRRMTLYREPSIRFGKDEVGGIRISHMSNIDRPVHIALTVTRGKRDPFTVQPLVEPATKRKPSPIDDALAEITVAETVEQVRAVWDQHSANLPPTDKKRLSDAMVAAKERIESDESGAA